MFPLPALTVIVGVLGRQLQVLLQAAHVTEGILALHHARADVAHVIAADHRGRAQAAEQQGITGSEQIHNSGGKHTLCRHAAPPEAALA